ncbi:MAG: hypothetical protein MUO64_16500 [Anaerolineales bacterium]|nr:hypothetical protein [Anaerolineales bacterium]
MTDNIQGVEPMYGNRAFPAPHPLTDEQKSQVQSILSQYDPSKVSAEDAKNIFKAFRQADIRPGPDLKNAISAAGFDAGNLRSLARPEGHHGHGYGHRHGAASVSGNGVNMSTLQSLQSILNQYDLSNMSPDQEKEILSKLNDAGLRGIGSGFVINKSA